MQCPKCQSNAHRSRSRSRWEQWRKGITGKRPYRCSACGVRFWAPDEGPTFSDDTRAIADRILAPDPPNLAGAATVRDDPALEEVDLRELDHPANDAPAE